MYYTLRVVIGFSLFHFSRAAFCPLYGPSFPAATNIAEDATIQGALKELKKTIETGFSTGNSNYGFVDPTSATALQIFSLQDSSMPLFEYYHDGNISNPAGVQQINGDTVFRIASISKLFAAYLVLVELGDAYWNMRVTDAIPELKGREKSKGDPVNYAAWEDITLGALAGQISGVVSNFLSFPIQFEESGPGLGLPPLEPSEWPCRIQSEDEPSCTRAETTNFCAKYETNIWEHAVYAAWICAGKFNWEIFQELVGSALVEPLGLTATSVYAPDVSNGVIPVNETISWWSVNFGVASPFGGMYSSLNDLSRIGRSILNSSLVDANTTRAWLKPTAFTSDLKGAVGRPWEIYRVADVVPNKGVVDLFCKGGDLPSYHTYICIIPDYNVGFTIALAGTGSHEWLDDLVVDTLLTALEIVAKEQADVAYTGTYKGTDGLNATMTLTTDEGLPGLGISEWVNNGTDVRELLVGLIAGEVTKESIRIVPTNLERNIGNGTEIVWRAFLTTSAVPDRNGPFSACMAWFTMDRISYGGFSVDEFLLTLGENGRAIYASPRVFKVVYEKQ